MKSADYSQTAHVCWFNANVIKWVRCRHLHALAAVKNPIATEGLFLSRFSSSCKHTHSQCYLWAFKCFPLSAQSKNIREIDELWEYPKK